MVEINPRSADCPQECGESCLRTVLVQKLTKAKDQVIQRQSWLTEQINHVTLKYLSKELQSTNVHRTSCSEPVVYRPLRSKIGLGKRKF